MGDRNKFFKFLQFIKLKLAVFNNILYNIANDIKLPFVV